MKLKFDLVKCEMEEVENLPSKEEELKLADFVKIDDDHFFERLSITWN